MHSLTDRWQFLKWALVFEGALIVLALVLGRLVHTFALARFQWQWQAAAWGVVGTLPLLLFFSFSYRFAGGPFVAIKRFLIDTLGPSLDACRWYDLVLLAAFVGFSEELLFRGVLHCWLAAHWGLLAALVITNVLFGLAHFVTPLYAVLAALIGVYLGLLFEFAGDSNLLVPMVAHAAYDCVGFLVVRQTYRFEQQRQVSHASG